MADLADVENALVGVVAGALYPSGTGQPSAIVAGARIYAGWPQANKLDADLRLGRDGPDSAKVVNVSIFPRDTERNTTRYARQWRHTASAPHTIVATVADDQVTLTGTVTVPQNVTVFARNKAYSYGVQTGNTLTAIAAALATLISADQPASSTGPVLTIADAWGLKVNIGSIGTMTRILRQQSKQFSIDIWAPTPELRVAAARVIDPALAVLGFLQYADGTFGRIMRAMTNDIDETQKELCYRRCFIEWCEWATIQSASAPEITAITEGLRAGVTPDDAPSSDVNYGGVT